MTFTPYTERNPHGKLDQYQTISFLSEYADLSLEELRLEDYKHGRTQSPRPVNGPILINMNKEGHSNLDLLRGPGIEICVGVSSSSAHTSTHDVWCLPRRLISHFSPFLKAAHECDFNKRQESRIELPDDDARVFGLFVQWMYYGDYTTTSAFTQSQQPGDRISIHARCWTLGDKLLCTNFKNYAMGHLHHQHTTAFPRKPIGTQDVKYACENSVAESKLRKFYFTFVVEHFDNPDRLQGSTEEWDDLLLTHADLRLLLLQNLRITVEERATVGVDTDYFDRYGALVASSEEHSQRTATHTSV